MSKGFNDFGTDKLTLTIPMGEFKIKSSKPFWGDLPKKKPNEEEPQQIPLLTTLEGEEVCFSKMFFNRENSLEKQKQVKAKNDLLVSINHFGLKVEFNPSKFGSNCDPTKLGKIQEIVQIQIPEIQMFLEKELGIICDLTGAFIFRLDISNQAELKNPFNSYFPYLRSERGFRQPKKIDYGNGFQFGTSKIVSVIYDKFCQLGLVKGYSNVIRSELQLEKPSGISTLGVYMGLREEDLKGEYNTQTAKRFLRNQTLQPDLGFMEVRDKFIWYCTTTNPKKAINSLIKGLGYPQLIEKLSDGGRDWKHSFGEILLEADYHPKTIYRRISEIEREIKFLVEDYQKIKGESDLKFSIQEMFAELKKDLFQVLV